MSRQLNTIILNYKNYFKKNFVDTGWKFFYTNHIISKTDTFFKLESTTHGYTNFDSLLNSEYYHAAATCR